MNISAANIRFPSAPENHTAHTTHIKEQVEVMRQKIEEQKVAIRTRMAAKEAYLQNYEDLLLKKKREKNERIQTEM